MKKVTIYDVAREAGVSLATVSRVINGSSVVRPATKEKVMKVIKKLDFKPNDIARGLATSKTTTIAIVFPQSLFANLKDMIGGIGDTGRHLDYNIIMYTSDDIGDENTFEDITERLVKSRVDGVILFNNDTIEIAIQEIQKYHLPIVVIGERISGDHLGSIYIDVENAIQEIVSRFIKEGKTNIGYVLPNQNLVKNSDIINGVKKIYKKHSLEVNEDMFIQSSSHYEMNYPMFVDYFKNHRYDAVVCGYDKDGVAVINAASDNGIVVPDDMQVVGMLNAQYSIMCKPTLSTLNFPVYDMGALAVRLLTKFLNDEKIDSKEVAVKYQFIQRESTK